MSDVLRVGYVHLKVTDLEEAKKHYQDILGLRVIHQDRDNKLYFKAWDEWDHHHLVLEEGGTGLTKFGVKVKGIDNLEYFEKKIQQFGCTTTRMSKGENYGVSEGVRVVLPSEHVME